MGQPAITVNHNLTRSILPASVILLLWALVLPGTPHVFAAKDIYLNEPVLSADGLQPGSLGRTDGDGHEFTLTCYDLASGLPSAVAVFSSIPAPAPEFAHTVSQARAPPLS